MDEQIEQAEKCAAWLRRQVYREASRNPGNPNAVADSVAALYPLLQSLAEYQQRARSMASTSTALAGLIRDLKTLGARSPSPRELDPTVLAKALSDSPEALADPILSVQMLGVRETDLYYPRAELLLQTAKETWALHVWGVWQLSGPWSLGPSQATFTATSVTLDGSEGRLYIEGCPILLPQAAAPSIPAPPPKTSALEVLERIRRRSRWDYEVVGSEADLALRGTCGMYDDGCLLQFYGVSSAFLPHGFSHATFRLERSNDGLIFGIADQTGSSSSRSYHVKARFLAFADDDGETQCTDLTALARTQPGSVNLPGNLGALKGPDDTEEGRALWALRHLWEPEEGPAAVASDLAWELIQGDEVDFAPDPLLPIEPQRRRARDLLAVSVALWPHEGRSRALIDIEDSQPSQRLLEDARCALACEIARREMGLEPGGITLDLEALNVGRVLADPQLEASLPEAEKRARAAGLAALASARPELLPDPEHRMRVEEMRANMDLGKLDRYTETIARRAHVDAYELTLMLADDPALPWYQVLLAILSGKFPG